MGGSSKQQTVGYKYHAGVHFVLGFGVADKISNIMVDEKVAVDIELSNETVTRIEIDKEELFGGESREGGIKGFLTFLDGSPFQGVNTYLASKLPAPVPAFRGVISVILEQMYLSMNPYLKGWEFRVQRIHRTSEGLIQWNDSKSALTFGDTTAELVGEEVFYDELDSNDNVLRTELAPFGSGDYTGLSINVPRGDDLAPFNSDWPEDTNMRIRHVFTTDRAYSDLRIVGLIKSAAKITVDGIVVAAINFPYTTIAQGGDLPESPPAFDIMLPSLSAGSHTLILEVQDLLPSSTPPFSNGNYAGVRIERADTSFQGMNPIHIVRECLTDTNWGMGYSEADIDSENFFAVADVIFDEGVGLCLLWDKQESIEKFVDKVNQHINAEIFVDRTTGKFNIKLIRDDYDPETIPVLSPSNITKLSRFKHAALGELVNSVSVSYHNVSIGATSTVTVQDIALVQEQGATLNTTVQYPGFPTAELASKAAQRDLKALSTPSVSCIVETSNVTDNLNIGSVFKLVWPEFGVNGIVMRVTKADFGDGKKNSVRLTCTQDVFVEPDTGLIIDEEVAFEDPSSIPSPAENPLGFEIPYFEMVQRESQTAVTSLLIDNPNAGYVGVAAARPTGGINSRMFTNSGAGFTEAGLLDFCPSGKLSADLTILGTDIIFIDPDAFSSIRIGSWFQLDDELLSLETLDGTVATVKRGILDTLPAPHSANTVALFWDDFSEGDPTEYISSDVVDIKLATVSGRGQLPLEFAEQFTVTLDGRAARPYPAANVKINSDLFPTYVSGSLVATWASRNRVQQTSGILTGWTEGNITPEAGTTYNVRIKQGETIIQQDDGISALTSTFNGLDFGVYELEITVIRDTLDSFNIFSHQFIFATIEPTGIPSAESFGSTSIVLGLVITPTSLASDEAFGSTVVANV